ncbi:MAG: hypothetical protein R3F14_43345 [Polyangiaceae bacterium]
MTPPSPPAPRSAASLPEYNRAVESLFLDDSRPAAASSSRRRRESPSASTRARRRLSARSPSSRYSAAAESVADHVILNLTPVTSCSGVDDAAVSSPRRTAPAAPSAAPSSTRSETPPLADYDAAFAERCRGRARLAVSAILLSPRFCIQSAR